MAIVISVSVHALLFSLKTNWKTSSTERKAREPQIRTINKKSVSIEDFGACDLTIDGILQSYWSICRRYWTVWQKLIKFRNMTNNRHDIFVSLWLFHHALRNAPNSTFITKYLLIIVTFNNEDWSIGRSMFPSQFLCPFIIGARTFCSLSDNQYWHESENIVE